MGIEWISIFEFKWNAVFMHQIILKLFKHIIIIFLYTE